MTHLVRNMVSFAKPAYESRAGYVGGAVLFLLVLVRVQGEGIPTHWDLLSILFAAFLCMLGWDLLARSRWYARYGRQWFQSDPRPWPVLIRSAFWRFLVNGLALVLIAWVVHSHPYFRGAAWDFPRLFYTVILLLYAVFGYPWHLLTLRRLGQRRYDFGDYALLTLIALRGLWRLVRGDSRASRCLRSRRVRKMLLIYLLVLFFLTLMLKFFPVQFGMLVSELAWFDLPHPYASAFDWFQHAYRVAYRLIFVLHVGIAVIAYSIASRWLDNRVRSIDFTLYGWFVVLVCYPPMNTGFTRQFINYRGQAPLNLPESFEILLMVAVLACYLLHLWAGMAMGFRFSNLSNRGIVTHGPYAWVRHPSYASKNLAWWLDNLQVLQSLWATVALAVWNWIYIQRALTEERHLSKDPAYRAYCQRVPDWFVPMRLLATWRGRASRRAVFIVTDEKGVTA